MGRIACNDCGLVPYCRCRDHQIHTVMAYFGTQASPDQGFLDTKVENPIRKKILLFVEPSFQNDRKLPISRYLQLDSALNLIQRDDACKELSLRLSSYPICYRRCSARSSQRGYDIGVDNMHSEGHIARLDLFPFDLATRKGQ